MVQCPCKKGAHLEHVKAHVDGDFPASQPESLRDGFDANLQALHRRQREHPEFISGVRLSLFQV